MEEVKMKKKLISLLTLVMLMVVGAFMTVQACDDVSCTKDIHHNHNYECVEEDCDHAHEVFSIPEGSAFHYIMLGYAVKGTAEYVYLVNPEGYAFSALIYGETFSAGQAELVELLLEALALPQTYGGAIASRIWCCGHYMLRSNGLSQERLAGSHRIVVHCVSTPCQIIATDHGMNIVGVCTGQVFRSTWVEVSTRHTNCGQ
jgi:hypothetical protein